MKISDVGIDLIIQFEGFSASPYADPASGGKPFTIGYGSTFYKDNTPVTMQDDDISKEDARDLLEYIVNKKSDVLNTLVKTELNQNQWDAICCLSYNIGEHNFASSTLLKLINSGNLDSAAKEFIKWDKAGGKAMAGLLRRRQAETDLFLKDA